jgi:hypothetical protein
VIEAVPPTRVGEAVASPVKRKRRGPILIGAGLMALLVAGVAYVQQTGNAEKVVPAPRPPAVVINDSSTWAPESALKSPPTTPAGGGAPVVSTSLPAPPTGNRGDATPSPPASASTDLGRRVADLVQRSGDSLAARQVLVDARSLEPRASSDADRAGLGLARAQALAYLDRQGEACSALQSVHKLSAGTRYQSKIDRLLQYTSC